MHDALIRSISKREDTIAVTFIVIIITTTAFITIIIGTIIIAFIIIGMEVPPSYEAPFRLTFRVQKKPEGFEFQSFAPC